MNLLTARQYAEHRRSLGLSGGTRQAAEQAVAEGRCPAVQRKPNRIDPVDAERVWAAQTDPTRMGGRKSGAGTEAAGTGAHAPPPAPARDVVTFAEARAQREWYAAEKARLEFERMAGELAPIEAQAQVIAHVARVTLTRVMDVAARSAGPVSAAARSASTMEQAQQDVRRLLESELRDALTEVSDAVG